MINAETEFIEISGEMVEQDKLSDRQLSVVLAVHNVTESFLERHIDRFTISMWRKVSYRPNLPKRFIKNNREYLNWEELGVSYHDLDYLVKEYPRDICWDAISRDRSLSEDQLIKYKDYLNWDKVIRNWMISVKVLKEIEDKLESVDWKTISQGPSVSDDLLKEFGHKIDWDVLSMNPWLMDIENLLPYKEKLNWNVLSRNSSLKTKHFRLYSDVLDWRFVQWFEHVPEDILDDKWDELNTAKLIQREALSAELIEKKIKVENLELMVYHQEFPEKLLVQTLDKAVQEGRRLKGENNLWLAITTRRANLSGEFLEKYKEYIIWGLASDHQRIPEKLLSEFINEVDWPSVSIQQSLTPNFIEEHIDKLNLELLSSNSRLKKETREYVNKLMQFQKSF